jgi:hypothetical protein
LGWLDRDESVSPDPAVAVAEELDRRRGELESEGTVVEDDKVVSRAVHFCEVEFHGREGA